MSQPLSWNHDVAQIPERGLAVDREASPSEREAVARALALIECPRLQVRYHIKGLAGGGYELSGSLRADVVQSCVVTLDPVSARIDEDFRVEYWPDAAAPAEEGELEALSAAEIEPLSHGLIDAGRIIVEQLGAALDPYPRAGDAALGEVSSPVATSADGPFAALAKLRKSDEPQR